MQVCKSGMQARIDNFLFMLFRKKENLKENLANTALVGYVKDLKHVCQ